MRFSNTDYEEYIGQYDILCFSEVSNLLDIERYILQSLRHALPLDTFVFAYPSSMKEDYYEYVAQKYGEQYRYITSGSTDLKLGFAFAAESPASVKHEMAHLAICGTWHDQSGASLGYIKEHPDSEDLPWCNR